MALFTGTAFLIASLVSTGAGIIQQEQASRKQSKANELQQRIGDIRAQRQRQRQVAELRKVRAANAVTAQAQGTSQSSSVAGATASATTQAASNINFLETTRRVGSEITSLQRGAARNMFNASVAGTASNFFAQGFQDKGGFKSLFEGGTDGAVK